MHFGAVGRTKRVDLGTQDWYTRLVRANDKPLILLHSLKLRGNPSLFPLGYSSIRHFSDRRKRSHNNASGLPERASFEACIPQCIPQSSPF